MLIKGKDVYFYIEVAGDNVALCHARTAVINTTATTLPTTTLGSGKGETNDYAGKYAYTIKCEGLTYIGDLVNGFNFQTAQTNFTKINWTLTDEQNIQWFGVVLVTSTTFDANFDALSTFANELLGDGEYDFTQTDVPPTPPIGAVVTIVDQFGTVIAVVPAPGTYAVTRFDTIDLRFVNNVTLAPITPDIVITQSA